MPVTRPYRRICRQFADGEYAEGGRSQYITHPSYAKSPEHYVRGFFLLLKDMQGLFDYVEPADKNLDTFSYRIHELLLRACVEVEANFKAILTENSYTKSGDLNMGDYRKTNASHRLHAYEVKLPFWRGSHNTRKPFAAWGVDKSLPWYQAYNATKHDRHDSFDSATLNHMTDAMAGLTVLLSSQFYTYDFGPGDVLLSVGGPDDGTEAAIGDYFRVRFPSDWPVEDRYDFDWQVLKLDPDPFQRFDYSKV
jgi:hypothetical protein